MEIEKEFLEKVMRLLESAEQALVDCKYVQAALYVEEVLVNVENRLASEDDDGGE